VWTGSAARLVAAAVDVWFRVVVVVCESTALRLMAPGLVGGECWGSSSCRIRRDWGSCGSLESPSEVSRRAAVETKVKGLFLWLRSFEPECACEPQNLRPELVSLECKSIEQPSWLWTVCVDVEQEDIRAR
jgi:hypothetical protein